MSAPMLGHRKSLPLWLRHAGPAMPFVGWRETLRASLGIAIGMVLLELLMQPVAADGLHGLFLIAPFGASAVLLFALPNSPLAQPWSAIIGNSVSALVAVVVVFQIADPALRAAVATPLAILAMMLCRALHPPGGAVALLTALSPAPALELGLGFVLVPVALGTTVMVFIAIGYGRLSGRHYPFRQSAEANASGSADDPALSRLAVSRAELAQLLQEFRQAANIGVEDLARIIAATERLSARHADDHLRCADIMSHDLVTVQPQTALREVAEIFRQRGFTSLPVVDAAGRYQGVIFQLHLITRGQSEARRSGSGLVSALARLLRPRGGAEITAAEVMSTSVPSLPPEADLAAALPLLAQGQTEAVPILQGDHILGIVTRTDLLAALARHRS